MTLNEKKNILVCTSTPTTDQSLLGTQRQLPSHGIGRQRLSTPWRRSGDPPQQCQEGLGPPEACNLELRECDPSYLHAYDWSSDHEQGRALALSVGCALCSVQSARDSEARESKSQRRCDREGWAGVGVEETHTKTGRRHNTPQSRAGAGSQIPRTRGMGCWESGQPKPTLGHRVDTSRPTMRRTNQQGARYQYELLHCGPQVLEDGNQMGVTVSMGTLLPRLRAPDRTFGQCYDPHRTAGQIRKRPLQ